MGDVFFVVSFNITMNSNALVKQLTYVTYIMDRLWWNIVHNVAHGKESTWVGPHDRVGERNEEKGGTGDI